LSSAESKDNSKIGSQYSFLARKVHCFFIIVFFCSVEIVPSAAKRSGIFSNFKKKIESGSMGNIVRMAKYDRAANVANAVTSLQLLNQDLKWHRLDDGVMGGSSETLQVCTAIDGFLNFQGTLNTNGGGFTSIRAPIPTLSDDVSAIRLRFRGDGKTYKVLLTNGQGFKSPSWQIDLPTKASKSSQEIVLPLNLFRPSFGPRTVSEKDLAKYKLIPSEMKEIGFMLSLKLSDGTSNPEETFGTGIFDFSLLLESIDLVEN